MTALRVLFSMLNPSTADAAKDDPTVRRCAGFARANGAHGFEDRHAWISDCQTYRYNLTRPGFQIVNPYAYRTSKPAELVSAARGGIDVCGPSNDRALRDAALSAGLVIIACGNPPPGLQGFDALLRRTAAILSLDGTRDLWCLGRTGAGYPRHPVRLAGDTKIERWSP